MQTPNLKLVAWLLFQIMVGNPRRTDARAPGHTDAHHSYVPSQLRRQGQQVQTVTDSIQSWIIVIKALLWIYFHYRHSCFCKNNFDPFRKQGKSEGFDSCNRPCNLAQIGSKSNFLAGVTLKFEGWTWKTIPNKTICVSFHSHPIIWIGVTNRNHSNLSQIISFSPCVTLKFERWPWKTIGHLLNPTSSFVRHFITVGEFKLELESGNAQYELKLAIFFVPCDFEIRWMTLKNNMAPLLYDFKLCSSFRSHWWIQTGVTVWKPPIWVKTDVFLSHATLKFDRRPWKIKGSLSSHTSSFVHHFIAIGEESGC